MYGVSMPSSNGYFASLADAVPSWAPVTRGAGSWSRQTAPAVNGTTFLELGTAQNTGRFDYADSVGRSMLLIEPTRVNINPNSLLVTGVPAGGLPDGYAATAGVALTDFETATGAPTGGRKFRWLDTAVNYRGGLYVMALAATTTYAISVLTRRTGAAGAGALLGIETNPGVYGGITLDATIHDWIREYALATTIGAGGDSFMLTPNGDPVGVTELCAPQIEAGDCATSPILDSAATATRAAELCTVDPGVVGRLSGCVSFLWRPDFASTASLTVSPCMWAWAAGYEIIYDPADDKIKVVVGGVNRASSAALTFARQGTVKITVRYGAAGTQLTTHVGAGAAATVADPAAWGDPGVLAPYLGSRAASVNCRPAAYADLLLAA